MTRKIYRPTVLTLAALATTIAAIAGTAARPSSLVAIEVSHIGALRAPENLHHPKPALSPSADTHWRFKPLYFNPDDPALFVPVRTGVGWTVNFGRPQAVLFLVIYVV